MHIGSNSLSASNIMASKRKWLTLEDKVSVLEDYEKTKSSHRQLAERFGVGKTQIANILKDKQTIYKSWRENGMNCHSKKKLKTEISDVDSIVYDWFCGARQKDILVSGPLIQGKAIEVSKTLGLIDNFKASNGWLHKFKQRHNISCKMICGKSADAPMQTAEDWKRKLKTLCVGYSERDIYNCDETGLLYRVLPNRTLCVRNDKCFGRKVAKERLTIFLCANMTGEFEDPLLIGNGLRPRCFKGVRLENLKMSWKANTNSWMTSDIMKEWLDMFNRKMERQKRNVILFLDNATCHPSVELSNVRLVFLPPDTSSVRQPLDLGVIKCFKQNYRKRILRHIICSIDSVSNVTKLVQNVTVLDAILWTISSLSCIGANVIKKCFLKAGFTEDFEIRTEDSCNDNGYQELEDLLKMVSNEATVEEYLNCDADLPTSNTETDIKAIIDLRTAEEREEVEEDIHDEGPAIEQCPRSYSEALNLVRQLEIFSKNENNTVCLQLVSHVKSEIEKQCVAKQNLTNQKKITNYFQSK